MTVSFVDSATASASTVTIPAGSSVGDWAILFDEGVEAGLPASVVPTGWTEIGADLTLTNARSIVSWKILVSGDPGAAITGMNGATSNQKVMFVFHSNLGAFASATPSTWNGEITDGNPVSQTVSASGQAAPLLVLAQSFATNGIGAFSVASPAFDATVAEVNGHLLGGYKIYNSSPADHSIDQADLGVRNTLRSGYVLLVEAAAAGVFTKNILVKQAVNRAVTF